MKKLTLLFVMLSFACFAQQGPKPAIVTMTPALKQEVIDTLSKALVANYVFEDKARHMADYLKGQSAKGAYRNITDPQEFAKQVGTDMQTACPDLHMNFRFNQQFAQMGPPPPMTPNPHMDSLRDNNMAQHNYGYDQVQILEGNVGYVEFNGFTDPTPRARETVEAAFRFVRYTKALFIDLRENHGGSPQMVKQVESYFFPERTRMNDIISHRGADTAKGFTDPTSTHGLLLQMPVYILTSNGTVSAAEDFAYGMQATKRAVIVGERTAGGSHPTGPVFLVHGFVASIPAAHSYNYLTRNEWEGTGVVPSIALKAGASLDDVLLTVFPDSWFASQKKAVDKPITTADVQTYLGTYQGGLKFYVKDNAFYCENPERGNQVFKLKYISPGFFLLDENVEVKFGQQQNGATGMQFHWTDGNVTFKEKIN